MNASVLLAAVVLAANPPAQQGSPVYTPSPELAAVIRGQTPTYDEMPAVVQPNVPGQYTPPVWYGTPPATYDPFLGQPAYGAYRPFSQHRTGIWGDFLFLSARGADMPFAAPVTVFDATPTGISNFYDPFLPAGAVGVADPEYDPGFRVGLAWALSPTSSLTANYWWYESHVSEALSAAALRSLTTVGDTGLPPTLGDLDLLGAVDDTGEQTDTTYTDAAARYDIDFQKVDLNYKWLAYGGCDYAVNYLVGVRYGHLEQNFAANYTGGTYVRTVDIDSDGVLGGAPDAATTLSRDTSVETDIDFDGVGPRIGIEGERLFGNSGFLLYGTGAANFLVGEFRADYAQTDTLFGPARLSWEDDRIVSLLEMELGLGWQDATGTLRLTAGYYIGAWFNTMTTPTFVNAVQTGNFSDADDTLTFDGLKAGLQWNF